LIEKDDLFDISKDELNEVLNPMKYIGRCPSQVDEFIENEVNPILEENINMIENIKEVEV
ncbi:MAG: adenylosuccinate lyase, partial [Parvimonas micra]|nr:adenylosuccinate lyase [Parvimonas micra]